MVYSRWDPTTGLYGYYEASDTAGLNDDLPTPKMPAPTRIGVPSVEAGRPLPEDAVLVGRGEGAQGSITPPENVTLYAQADATAEKQGFLKGFLWGVAVVGLVGYAVLWQTRRR